MSAELMPDMNSPCDWCTFQFEDGSFHCVPRGDDHEHFTEDCKCDPYPDPEYPHIMNHNSFDGREDFETGKRKVS